MEMFISFFAMLFCFTAIEGKKLRLICKGQSGTLSCPSPNETVIIESAKYERLNPVFCPDPTATDATPYCSSSALGQVSKICGDGKGSCTFSFATATVGVEDSCPAVQKYLLITYSCVQREPLPWLVEEKFGYLFAMFNSRMNYANAQAQCSKIGATLPMMKTNVAYVAINDYHNSGCTGPKGWTQRGSIWYKTMSNLTYSFEEASTYCRSFGAELPTIKNKEELNNLIASTKLKCRLSPYKDNICYTFGEIKQSHDVATETCRSAGGFLAIPNSQDEINFIKDSFVELLNMVKAEPWIGLTCANPFKCKSKGCLSPPVQKECVPLVGLLCPPVVPVSYWQWILDNSGTMIRNLSAADFDNTGLSMTADAVTNCMAIDSQGGLNDFSKCGSLKNVACQYHTLLTDPVWIGITKKNCSTLCTNEACQGQLIWNDGQEVDINLLNVKVYVKIADPIDTMECSTRFVFDGVTLSDVKLTNEEMGFVCQYTKCKKDCFQSISYQGLTLASLSADSPESCHWYCTNNRDCAGFIFNISDSTNKSTNCDIKLELLSGVPDMDVIAGPRDCGGTVPQLTKIDVCESANATLSCPDGIHLISAFYGRIDANTCTDTDLTAYFADKSLENCTVEDWTSYLTDRCEYRDSCEVASLVRTNDPCVNFTKFVRLQYRCLPEYCFEDSTMYTLVNFSMSTKRSPVECQTLCQSNPQCGGFSYNFANRSCYQLNKVYKTNGNAGSANGDLVNWMSGPKFCNLPNKTEISSEGGDTPVWLGLENHDGTVCTVDDCAEVLTWSDGTKLSANFLLIQDANSSGLPNKCFLMRGGNMVEESCDVQAATICMYDCPNATCYTPLQDLALSAPANDDFTKVVAKTKYLYNQIFEFYSSKVGNNPWLIFDIGDIRKVSQVVIFIRPGSWSNLTNIEVRVGKNGTTAGFTTNPLCGATYSGPADVSVDVILSFKCVSAFGRFVSVQQSGSNISLSIAHVKIDTVPNEELTFGEAGAGNYGSWDVCPGGSVVIGVKEKVAPEKKSALNAIKLRCTSFDDVTSSEGNEGDYGQLFSYCFKGFSHARMATNNDEATNFQMNCLGPTIGPLEPPNRYPTEGNWSEWQACDVGWKICGIKTKVAPGSGITGLSVKCCPMSCPNYAPFAFANGTLCCGSAFASGNPILANVNETGVPIKITDFDCMGLQFDCPLTKGVCENHPSANIKVYNSSMNVSLDGIFQHPPSFVLDRKISRSVYLPMEESYYQSRSNESNPWIALNLGNIWTIKSVSIVRQTDDLTAQLFEKISVRIGTKVPQVYGILLQNTDYPLCASFGGPPGLTTPEYVDFICPNNTKGNVIVVQKEGKILSIEEIRFALNPIEPPLVNGSWSLPVTISPCTATCGAGTKKVILTCNNPPPSGGGLPCGVNFTETRDVRCNMDPCPDFNATDMCADGRSPYDVCKTPFNQQCYEMNVNYDGNDIRNSDALTVDAIRCQSRCQLMKDCVGFSYQVISKLCKLKFQLGNKQQMSNSISGTQFCAPWILMYKQDVLASNPDSQTFVRSDNETASVNLMDPQLVNLYSNLDQLVNLKNYKSGMFTFKLEYPRVIDDMPYYTWQQSSNPLLEKTVAGYTGMITHLDLSSNVTGVNQFKFGGLARDSSGNATIDGVPAGKESWYSIGAKVPFPDQGMFHGVMGHGEFDLGYVTMVNLYTLRQFQTPENGITVTSYPSGTAKNDIKLLTDCKALCLPDPSIYFSTGVQRWPHIFFDLGSDRVVYGVQLYVRIDTATHFDGLTNLYVLVGNSSIQLNSATEPPPDNLCNLYKGPPTKGQKSIKIDCLSPMGGKVVTLAKDSSTKDSEISLNEVRFVLNGQPTAFSSSYQANAIENYAPKYALTNASTGTQYFRSVRELYPWLLIDYETPRVFANITIMIKNSTDAFDVFKMIEIRAGYEQVTEYATLLTVNIACSKFFEGPTTAGQSKVVFNCVPPLEGRYLTIQKTVFGVLQLDQVIIEPKIVDGNWSLAPTWSLCSQTCGNGTRTKIRTCTNPTPANGGRFCTGNATIWERCNMFPCPVNGEWSVWAAWSNCSNSCGLGTQTRTRGCTNPVPDPDGYPCVGDDSQVQECGNATEECSKKCVLTCCKDYKLLPGSNEMWPNVAYGDPLPAIKDCCVIPQWTDASYLSQTCVPPPSPTNPSGNVDDSGTVVLPTDPANLTTVQFPSTTIYYWPNFDLNATTNTSYQVVNGPFQFGEAVKLDKKKSECLEDANFINPDDKCFVDPINCNEGLSLSLFYQVTDPNDAGTKGVKEYILSTGGDDRNPGVGIYFDGVDLCVKLCAGAYTWSLNIAGQRPTDTNWYNIAIRWAMPTYSNATDFQVQKMKNVKTKDFGGLELFVNMKSIGFVLLPDEVGCAMTSPTQTCNASAQATGKPLNPPEVLLGCHKTQNNTVLRNFGSGIYDEVAFWKRRLNETELPYFLGGYKTSLENIAVDVLLQILQSVDMSDSAQANTAISIVNTLVSGPAATLTPTGNVYQTSTAAPPTTAAAVGSGNQVTTTGVTTSTTTKATTTTAKVDLADEIRALIKVMNTLTNANTIPTDVYERSFEIMFNVAKPVGAILSSEGSKYQAGWEAYNENPSDSSPHINREQLENYLVTLMKNRRSNYVRGGTSYSGVRSSNNHIVQLQKMTAQEFVALPAAGETHLILPDWEDGNWTNYMTNTKMGSMPIERVQIPTNIFSGSCKTQNVNLLFSMYNTFPDPGKKNPVNIPANRIVLDSRVMTINITADPLPGRTDLCLPDPKLLLSYPLTLDFMMTSGLQQSVTASRSLKFHDESTETKIKRRYCAVWNEDINGGGAWDTVNTKEIYLDDTVATCFATRLGTFAVVSEIEEAPYVPPDFTWLMVIKMIGYVLSFILLITFAVAVFTSVMLWEMFHIIGMNLSLALFGGNVSMVLSEIQGIRSDRHLCAASGITTNFFYTAAAILLMMESHAIFKATTSGIIGGKTRGYLCIGWGVPFIAVGLNIYMQLLDMGDDPRCMVGWSNLVKWYFFVPVIFAAAYSLVAMLVVICNLQAPALRKKSLVDDHSTLAKGVFALVFVYALCWSWAPVAYINFPGMELPQFYPAFQILNSFMGFFTFICIGLGSRKFRAYAVKTYNSKMEKKH